MSTEIIRVENLTFSHNGTEALSNISFSVKKGDYLGIVGPNGSGKSTLIRNILGILQPQRGSINLFGQPLALFDQWHRLGYLPQRISSLNAHFPCNVAEIVSLGIRGNKNASPRETLSLMGIEHLSSRMIGELSYGEQQRAMLARALVGQPELLLLDEPTTALDPETRDIFYNLAGELNKKKNVTVILITHDTGTIGQYARELLYLDKKIIFSGTFSDFCSSDDMAGLFGTGSQHIICHQHNKTGSH